MSQESFPETTNFSVPAKFSFRPFRAKWVPCRVETIEWTPTGKTMLTGPLEKQCVTAKVELLLPKADPRFGASSKVAINCAEFPNAPVLLKSSEETSANIAGRVYTALACVELPGSLGPEKNARQMLQRFNELPQDVSRRSKKDRERAVTELLEFLNCWGLWSSDRGYELYGEGNFAGFALVFPEAIWGWQAYFTRAQNMGHGAWLRDSARLPKFKQMDSFPYFKFEHSYCVDALHLQITVHHLEGAQFGRCRRKDCRRPYQRSSKQKRFYCSTACAHLAYVRKKRDIDRKLISEGEAHKEF